MLQTFRLYIFLKSTISWIVSQANAVHVTPCVPISFVSDASSMMVTTESLPLNLKTTAEHNINYSNGSANHISAQFLYKYWYGVILYLGLVLFIAVFIGNLLVAVAFLKFPLLRSTTNIFIVNLSLCDMAFSIMACYIWLTNYTLRGLEFTINFKFSCLLSLYMTAVSLSLSLFGIFALSVERFIAVVFALKYYTIVTEKRCVSVCLGFVLLFMTIEVFPLLGWNTWQKGTACFAFQVYPKAFLIYVSTLPRIVLLVLVLVLHVSVSLVAWKKSSITPVQVANSFPQPMSSDFKITKMFFLVIGTFYICWLPFLIMCVILMVDNFYPNYLVIAFDFSKCLLSLNSVLNPVIYAWKNEKYRSAFCKILRLKWSWTACTQALVTWYD